MNAPKELHSFDKVFAQIASRWDYSQIFNDFLDISISNFQQVPTEGLAERMKSRYSERELDLFGQLFTTWITSMNDAVSTDDWIWCDLLGMYYEYIASSFKRSQFGQFFTPHAIVELMTRMTMNEPTEGIQTVSDPACGSGRTLLSAHMHMKGNIRAYAEDLDGMCCKMTVLNFLIHGVEGEVVHHDSLMMKHYLGGWKVNEHRSKGLFSIRPVSHEESYIMQYGEIMNGKPQQAQPPEPVQEQIIIEF